MRKLMIAGLLALSVTALVGCAQQEPVPEPVVTNDVASKAGQYSNVKTIKATAVVTAIDANTRKISLKDSKGKNFDIVAGKEVKNFAQIQVNDWVVLRYVQAISLQLKKSSGPRAGAEVVDSASAPLGEKPAGAVGREVQVIADVIGVDKKKKTITLKGPKGKVVTLDVKNPDHFKVVKVGDQVVVDYVEAVAISVEKAPKATKKKKAAPAASAAK